MTVFAPFLITPLSALAAAAIVYWTQNELLAQPSDRTNAYEISIPDYRLA